MAKHKISFFTILVVLAGIALLDPGLISVDAFLGEGVTDNPDSLTPNLPFGDINIVVLTDIHSWLGSHRRQEPYNDVDFGDVLSFWQRLKEHCDSNEIDIFFVNNGDFVHGTGLSHVVEDVSDPEYIIPLLEKMPYDLVNVGNHELYDKKNIDFMIRPGGYVDWWGDRYLTSNIHRIDNGDDNKSVTKTPLGNRYKILQGRNSKTLAFGFLYNFRDVGSGAAIGVEKVQTVVTQEWFLDALTEEDYDAILVLAHMDLVDPCVEVIRSAIRNHLGEETTPIVFLTGHTHYRGFKQLEDSTITFESGRYMDTVGFTSFPKKDTVIDRSGEGASSLFQHSYLDTNRKFLFEDTLGFSSFEEGQTKDGKALSEFIDRTRKKLGLETEVGCAPRSYHMQRHIDSPDSLWGLFRDEVVPKAFHDEERDDLPTAMIVPSQTWRYDLFNTSTLVVDDVIAIAPFNDTLIYLGAFSRDAILKANKTLNSYHEDTDDNDGESISLSSLSFLLPRDILIGDFDTDSTGKYHLYTFDFGMEKIKSAIQKAEPAAEVVTVRTKFTSTLTWLAFVQEFWSCDGSTSAGARLPTPENESSPTVYSNSFPPLMSESDELFVMVGTINLLVKEIVIWRVACACMVCLSVWILARLGTWILARGRRRHYRLVIVEEAGYEYFQMEGGDDIECKL